MHTTHLRKVGGSVMLAVPPALLDILQLSADAQVGLTVDNGRLIIEPKPVPSYTLSELLAKCDPNAELTDEDRQWLNATPVGKEEL
ncbi:antitoxin [Candidatus Pantoea alvi]|uniref:AbrB/MazE/SpoVT family DNA-binding domain-containing protein n=1 Tax=Enterobacter agglomerans TaxID=549 RepID=UPI000CDD61F1|nr:antitoxin [Pantoea agglomerans]POW60817.1 antitoxin [Pantoea alvi]UBN53985.1 antitoxin [Pantoea agglomerans]